MPETSSAAELRNLLALKFIKGVGNRGAIRLLDQFGSASQLFASSASLLADKNLKPDLIKKIRQVEFQQADACLEWAATGNRHLIPFNSPLYPQLLAAIHSPPLVLFALGNPELLMSQQLAVVGSRRPSAQGLANTQAFCESLSRQGMTITSGMALGIDGAAHRAVLDAGGATIAVTGTGLDRVYPRQHRELAHQIADKGLMVSEQLPEATHKPHCFAARNRIIAGLCLGTLVVEAASKSGTLITANHSMEEGREVFAIPGSIHNPLAKGCHHLIQQGAKLVQTVEDILQDLPIARQPAGNSSPENSSDTPDNETLAFLQCIDYEPTPIDLIVSRSQLTVDAVTNKLLILELEGWVINSVGGFIRQ